VRNRTLWDQLEFCTHYDKSKVKKVADLCDRAAMLEMAGSTT